MPDKTDDNRRKRGARLVDIARMAGVSVGTVDRILNERGSFAPGTREKVVAAARSLGAQRTLPETWHAALHVDILLPDNATPFFRRLSWAFQKMAVALAPRVILHRRLIPLHRAEFFIQAVQAPDRVRGGIILSAMDTPAVKGALEQAIAQGVTVVTVAADISLEAPHHYVGIDHAAAGRVAGHFIGRMARRGRDVLLLQGWHGYVPYQQRAGGCREVIAARYPELNCVTPDEQTLDDPAVARRLVAEALRTGNLAAIYDTGYGSPGIIAALNDAGLSEHVLWAAHEIYDDHVVALHEGVMDLAIDQGPDAQAAAAVRHVLVANGIPFPESFAVATEFRLFCRENTPTLPYFPADRPGSAGTKAGG